MKTDKLTPYQKPLTILIELDSEQVLALSGYENDDDGWSQSTDRGDLFNW